MQPKMYLQFGAATFCTMSSESYAGYWDALQVLRCTRKQGNFQKAHCITFFKQAAAPECSKISVRTDVIYVPVGGSTKGAGFTPSGL